LCLDKWFITAQIAFCHCTFSIYHCTFCASLRIILCPDYYYYYYQGYLYSARALNAANALQSQLHVK